MIVPRPLNTGVIAANPVTIPAVGPDGKPISVSFPSGPGVELWIKVCRTCGAQAGGCFSGPGLPEPRINPYSICPGCGGSDIELRPDDAGAFIAELQKIANRQLGKPMSNLEEER